MKAVPRSLSASCSTSPFDKSNNHSPAWGAASEVKPKTEVYVNPDASGRNPMAGCGRMSRANRQPLKRINRENYFIGNPTAFARIASTECGEIPSSTNPGIFGDDTVSICISST